MYDWGYWVLGYRILGFRILGSWVHGLKEGLLSLYDTPMHIMGYFQMPGIGKVQSSGDLALFIKGLNVFFLIKIEGLMNLKTIDSLIYIACAIVHWLYLFHLSPLCKCFFSNYVPNHPSCIS